jgi:hypothetical protein
VASKQSGEMDIFWHRRNTFIDDWWKQGDDKSSVVSSVWLSLSQNNIEAEFRSRLMSTQLSNDLVVLAMSKGSKTALSDEALISASVLKPHLHSTTLRISQPDSEIDPRKEEAWIDVQIENLSTSSTEEVDLSTLFKSPSKIFFQAATLHSLTYLSTISSRTGTAFQGLRSNSNMEKGPYGCVLQPRDGGKVVALIVGARRICSVRIPVSLTDKTDDSTEN